MSGLVLVDDDNVLSEDYLAQAVLIAWEKPFLGTFGGVVAADYEGVAEAARCPCPRMLGIREVPVSVWGNDIAHWPSTPIGVGLCLRREVSAAYREACRRHPVRQGLDRRGASLVSGGDMDIVYTGVAHGFGMGVFRSLRLTPLIPNARLEPGYLTRLSESTGFSAVIRDALWNREGHTESCFPGRFSLLKRACLLANDRLRRRRYLAARRSGMARGRRYLADLRTKNASVFNPLPPEASGT